MSTRGTFRKGFLKHGWVLLARRYCSSIAAPGRYLERNSNNSIVAIGRHEAFLQICSPSARKEAFPQGMTLHKPSIPRVLCLNSLGPG
jgi:hypothetical protein